MRTADHNCIPTGDGFAVRWWFRRRAVPTGFGAPTTHVFVPPTPGPLAVADEIGVDLGMTIPLGVVTAVPAALVAGIGYGRWINRLLDIPLRDAMATWTAVATL